MNSSASVVIPAHNEEAVIGRCLASLVAQPGIEHVEVLVVANGCSDGTARVAATFAGRLPRLSVLELAPASKVGALNEGDRRASAHPRIFLDADVTLGEGALPQLVSSLSRPEAVVGAPRPLFDLDGARWAVRRFYDVFIELPYATEGLTGLGVYGLSEAGRSRFGAFPDVLADDLFVQRQFTSAERVTSAGTFTVRTPRRLTDLVAVRTRVARGNAALARMATATSGGTTMAQVSSTRETARALLRLVLRRPRLVLGAGIYIGVTLVARRRARAMAEGTPWERDNSSRTPAGAT